MACLGARRDELASLVEVLVSGQGQAVRNDLIEEIVDNLPIEQVEGREEIERLLDQLTQGAGGIGIATVVVLL